MKHFSKRKSIIFILFILAIILTLRFFSYLHKAKTQLATYDSLAKTLDTSYGTMSYIDAGLGEPILICHGLLGGYEQAYDIFHNMTNTYRILAPSRFGYTGTDLPKDATVKDQSDAYCELLDALGIEKTYILGTSAGGLCALRFAIEHPERVKGVILFCSGGIEATKPKTEDIPSYVSVPKPFCNDFTLWLIGPIMRNKMSMSDEDWRSVFPVSSKAKGVINDGYHANRDSDVNYDEYTLENLDVPVLALHAKDDQLASYEKISNMMARIPNSTFVSFDTGGHMITGHSEEIDAAIAAFTTSN